MKSRFSKLDRKTSKGDVASSASSTNAADWDQGKLVALLGHSIEGITVLGLDRRVIKAFRGGGAIWARSSEESLGASAIDLVHPDDYEYMLEIMDEAIAEPNRWVYFEARIIRSGDAWHWAEGSAKSFFDDPEIGGVAFTFRDCHERKVLEDQSRSSSSSFQSLVENSADAMVGVSIEQRVIVWNLAAEEMFGYSADEIVGQPLSMLLPEDRRDLHDSLVDGFAEENVERRPMTTGSQMLAIRRNGVRFPVEVGLAKVSFNGAIMLLATVRDVTVRRLVEVSAELAHSELQAVMTAIPDAICRLDSDGTILDLMADRDGGLPLPPDSIGKCIVDVLPPGVGPICQSGIDEALANGVVTQMEFDVAATDIDGPRSFESRHVPLASDEVIAVVRDVTERVSATDELRRASDRFRTLTETSFENLVVVDTDDVITYMGGPDMTTLGYRSQDFVGQKLPAIAEVAHPEDQGKLLAEYEKISKNPGYRSMVEARLYHVDGSLRWLQISSRNLYYDEAVGGVVLNIRDITKERLALADLSITSDRFRHLADSSHEGLLVLDESGVITYTSGPEMGLLGIPIADHVGGSLMGLVDLAAPEDHARVLAEYERVLAEPESTGFVEGRFRHTSGDWVWIAVVFRNLLHESSVAGIVINSSDITARKTAEIELRKASDRSNYLASSSLDIVSILDENYVITYLGGPATTALGESEQSLVGTSVLDTIKRAHPDDREASLTEYARVMSEPRSVGVFEARLPHADGSWRWISVSLRNLFHVDAISGLVTNARDITQRKAAEAEIQRASDRSRFLAESSLDVVTISDQAGLITYVGGPEVTGLGWDKADVAGNSVLDSFSRAHPDDRERVMAEFDRVWSEPRSVGFFAARMKHIDGSWRWLSVTMRNLLHEDAIEGILLNSRDITEQKKAEIEVVNTSVRSRFLAESSLDITSILDENGLITYVGGRELTTLGRQSKDLIGTSMAESFERAHPDDRERVIAELSRVMSKPRSVGLFEARFEHVDGSWHWMSVTLRNLFHEEAVEGLVLNSRDINDRKKAELELRRAGERSKFLAESSLDVVTISDRDGNITYLGGPEKTGLGRDIGTLIGTSVLVGLREAHPDDRDRVLSEYQRVLTEPRSIGSFEARLRHEDGSWRWIFVTMRNLFHEEAIEGLVFNARDVTDRKEAELKLEHQVLHDSLTELPNRSLLSDRLEHALARSSRRGGMVGLLFLDLDRFKNINDTLGHSAGDQLLVGVAERLQGVVRESDTLARLGGDEFVVLGEDVASTEELFTLAERMLESLGTPIQIGDREFYTTASIGIALSLDGDHDAETLMRNADAAMYRAKQAGRNRIEAFDHALQVRLEHRIGTETALRGALQREELQMFYQPVIDLQDGTIIGAEALIRWQHPTRGLVFPDEFIPIAEETDLIRSIGAWVARRTCEQVTEWKQRLGTDLHLAINISARQLASRDLTTMIVDVVEATGIDPQQLCVEITETALIDQPDIAIANLSSLRELGIQVALDDFGTGYASLAYLRTLPITQIKIDRSFTSGLGEKPNDMVIVQSTIELAHGLGLTVVGEGVETVEQMNHLREFGCDFVQGYFFGRPESPDVFELGLAEGIKLPG